MIQKLRTSTQLTQQHNVTFGKEIKKTKMLKDMQTDDNLGFHITSPQVLLQEKTLISCHASYRIGCVRKQTLILFGNETGNGRYTFATLLMLRSLSGLLCYYNMQFRDTELGARHQHFNRHSIFTKTVSSLIASYNFIMQDFLHYINLVQQLLNGTHVDEIHQYNP